MRSSGPTLALEHVRKRFSHRRAWVLDGVDLALEPGSVNLVVGANGSGKSTLLRILARVSQPTSGRVLGGGKIGYVPDRLPARVPMTGREYLSHMGRIRGLDSRTAAARIESVLERLELRPGPDVAVELLSKGNRQKVMLAQAFLAPVDALVLDEPYSGLDPDAHHFLTDLVDEARRNGAAVLISAHRSDVFGTADRTQRIDDGRLHEGTEARRPAPAEVAAMRVTLAPRNADADAAALGDLGGVRSVNAKADASVTLVVDRSETDRVIAAAIATGWSVRTVQRQRDPT